MRSTRGQAPAAKAPISAHPAFPAIVALWFAALFGIGSFVLPVALFEKVSVASGVSSLVASAQPPLGMTARIIIAAAAAGMGALAGVMIARQVSAATAPAPRAPRRAAVPAAKRPISIHDEVGTDGLAQDDSRGEIAGRRRALSINDESARSDFLELAPLPGDSATDIAAEADPVAIPAEATGAHADPLDLAAFDADPVADSDADELSTPFGSAALSSLPTAGETPRVPLAARFADGGASAGAPIYRSAETNEDFPAMTQPAASLDDTEAPFAPRMAVPFTAAAPFAPPASFSPATGDPRFNPGGNAQPAEPAVPAPADQPLADLDIAQLVDRFAQALERRQVAATESAPAIVFPAREPAEPAATMTGATPDAERSTIPVAPQAGEIGAAMFAGNPGPAFASMPAALMPVAYEDEDDNEFEDENAVPSLDLTTAFAQRQRLFDEPAPAPFAPGSEPSLDVEAESEVEDEADDAYSSLLAMKSPFGLPREAVRIDEDEFDADEPVIEPVVVFPHQAVSPPAAPRRFDAPGGSAPSAASARSDHADTERALRDALEKLQRLSGAA